MYYYYMYICIFVFLSGCGAAPRQPVVLTINTIFADPQQVQVIYGKPESVKGIYYSKTKTIVVPTPRDWHDYGAMETIGHEFMHLFYAHEKDWWLPGKGEFE